MKKQLNTEAITNELAGSVFFPSRTIERTQQEQAALPTSLASQTPEQKKEIPTHDTVVSRYHDTKQPDNHDTITTDNEDVVLEAVRKAVKQVGKEAATQRLTLEEKQALAEIEYSYKRQGMRTSGNEITRIAINYVIDDYQKNGEHSLLAKVLKRLYT